MTNENKEKVNNWKKWVPLFIVFLIVVAAGVFKMDVSFKSEIVDLNIKHNNAEQEKTIIIKNVNSKKPDFVTLKNTTASPINIKGYKLIEGGSIYKINSSYIDTNISPNANITIYFVKKGDPLLNDRTKLVSTSFRIKSGESIELEDALGNVIDYSKAL